MSTSWATSFDIYRMLTAAGIAENGLNQFQQAIDFNTALATAQKHIERETMFEPFLATASSSLTFDPWEVKYNSERLLLQLPGGLASNHPVTIVANSQTLTQDSDYWMMSQRAIAAGKPFYAIEFLHPPSGPRKSLVITGYWGYSDVLPDYIFRAHVQLTCVQIAPEIAQALSGGLISWKEADTEEAYGADRLKVAVAGWNDAANKAINLCRKTSYRVF